MRLIQKTFLVLIPALLLLTGCGSMVGAAAPAPASSIPDVIINHLGGSQLPGGIIQKRRGERVRIEVRQTETECYSFNFKVTDDEHETPASDTVFDYDDVVPFEVTFRGTPIAIEIEAIRINDDPGCARGGERKTGGPLPPWEVRIATDGWDVHFAGAFTADQLNNPVYTLIDEDRDLDNDVNHTKETSGYVVTEREDQEDSFRLAAAAMVHVIHTDPDRFNIFDRDINWVPLSFGLGVGENSQTRYFLGTGIRFGEKFFLTGGATVGPVTRLPSKLRVGDFTTDGTVLNDPLPTRNDTAFFIGMSYTFAGVGRDAFTGPFATVKPEPPAPAPAPAATTLPPVVEQDGAPAVNGNQVTYRFRVFNPPGAATLTGAQIAHTPHAAATATNITCTSTGAGAIAGTCTGAAVTLPLTVTLNPDASYTFTVVSTLPAGHAAGNATVTLTHADLTNNPMSVPIAIP